jgi:hypothetical protein
MPEHDAAKQIQTHASVLTDVVAVATSTEPGYCATCSQTLCQLRTQIAHAVVELHWLCCGSCKLQMWVPSKALHWRRLGEEACRPHVLAGSVALLQFVMLHIALGDLSAVYIWLLQLDLVWFYLTLNHPTSLAAHVAQENKLAC